MKNVLASILSLVAGLSLSLAAGCGDSGSSGGAGGIVGKGGSGIAGQSGRGGSMGTGGDARSSGGASGCTLCDAGVDAGTTGGTGGRGGAGGATAFQGDVATEAAWPDVPNTGGAGGSSDSGAGETGENIDSSTDGPVDRSVDTLACIELGDIPSAYVRTEDPSTQLSSMWVLDGPCDASVSMGIVTFYYWEKGYSCPRLSDRVTCQVQATSSAGATTVFSVDFVAVPLGGSMLHWQAEPSQIGLSFPRLDGGAAG